MKHPHFFRIPRFTFRRSDPRPGAAAAIGAALTAAVFAGQLPFSASAAAVFAALFFLSRRSAVALAAGGIAVGIGTVVLSVSGAASLDRRIPEEARRTELRLRLEDPRLTGAEEAPLPASVLAEVHALRDPENGTWERTSGRCMVRLPRNCRAPNRGSVVEAEGILRRVLPREAVLHTGDGGLRRIPFGESFRRHLAARGCKFTFRADRIRGIRGGETGGFAGTLRKVRDTLLRNLLRGIDSDRDRALISAFFFGTTGGLDAEARRNFIASGTVHLFAVSGLHIGMLATAVLALLRPLPFRLRHWCLPAAVWCYVLLTGANAPAVRVGIMVSLWSIGRAALKFVPSIDLLGGAAVLLLATQPMLIGDLGFRYSFVITAALLLLAERRREFLRLAAVETQLIPSPTDRRRQLARSRWSRKSAEALIGCSAAFLAGAGISLSGPGQLLPGSVIANLAMLPFLPLFFGAAALQLLTGGNCAAPLAECFEFLSAVAGIIGSIFAEIPAAKPGTAALLLYCAGLFLWFGHPSPRLRLGGAALSLALLGSWIAEPRFTPPKLLMLSRSGAAPAVFAVSDPANARALVVNPVAGEATEFLVETLRNAGVRHVETIFFDRPRRDRAAGAARLEHSLPVRRRRLPLLDRHAGRFLQELEERAKREDAVSVGSGGELLTTETPGAGNLRLVIADRLGGIRAEAEAADTDSGRRFVVRKADGTAKELTLPWSRELQVWETPL